MGNTNKDGSKKEARATKAQLRLVRAHALTNGAAYFKELAKDPQAAVKKAGPKIVLSETQVAWIKGECSIVKVNRFGALEPKIIPIVSLRD